MCYFYLYCLDEINYVTFGIVFALSAGTTTCIPLSVAMLDASFKGVLAFRASLF